MLLCKGPWAVGCVDYVVRMSIDPTPADMVSAAALVAQIRASLADLSSVPAWRLGDAELLTTTQDLYRLVDAVNA